MIYEVVDYVKTRIKAVSGLFSDRKWFVLGSYKYFFSLHRGNGYFSERICGFIVLSLHQEFWFELRVTSADYRHILFSEA